METIKIYKNYGCLAAEKRSIYTYGAEQPTATCADVIIVKIPDGWKVINSENDILLESPWGWAGHIIQIICCTEMRILVLWDMIGTEGFLISHWK